MKASFNRKRLLDAFSTVSSVAPTRSPKPILQNVLMTTDGHEVTLIGTDMEIGVRKTLALTDVTVYEPGQVLLPIDRFGSILRTSSDEQVEIEVDGDKIQIKVGRSKFNLTSEDPAKYPSVPDFAAESYAVLYAGDLKAMIRRTIYATDVDTTRFALGGCLVEFGDDGVTMVATDGRRLAKAVYPAEYVGERGFIGQPIAPTKALKLIDKAIEDDGSQVHLAIDTGKSVLIRSEDAVIVARLVEGRYPKYTDAIPQEVAFTIPLKVGSLKSGVELAAICATKESRGVRLAFEKDMVWMSAESSDAGRSDVRVPYDAAIEGLDVAVTVDPHFVADAIRFLDAETVIEVRLNDGKSPMVMVDGDRYISVIMPIVLS